MNKKILVIGASGLIGRAICEALGSDRNWIGTYYKRVIPGGVKLDITDPGQVKRVFAEIMPTHVIHCAQLAGGVDFYEGNPDLAKKFHFEGTVNIGKQCLENNSWFIFISSECVFDGKKEFYNEADQVNPLNIYGKFKALSEEWITRNMKDYIIVRSMSVYGWDPFTKTPNALMKAYFSVLNRIRVFVPVYRWGTPTYVKDLSKAILELCLSKETGVFHIAGSSYINRYEWLKKSFDYLGWDSSLILPQTDIPKDAAMRPFKIGLDTKKFCSKFKTKLHALDEGLKFLKEDVLSGTKEARLVK